MARDVRIAILGDSRDFSRAVSAANSDASRLQGTFSKVGSFAKTAAMGLGVVAVGAGALAKSFVDAAYESQKVTAQTDAVIKSMGLSAQASAEDIAKLSTQLSLKTGIDDELIQSGSNVLLTFGNVADQIGKDSKVFERANAAALDMSVALGTDMSSAAMMVGKALNDPIRGLTALRRSGIQFTEQQEEQIKAMVEAGDVAGAQAIMLGELEKQFGGSAEAQATAADKLKVAWGNVQEELGAKLIPVLETVATWLAAHLPGAMADAQAFMDNTLIPAFRRVSAFVQEHWPKIRETIERAVEGVKNFVTPIVEALQALWDNFGNNVLEFVKRVWPDIQNVIEAVMEVIRTTIQTVTALIQGDWKGVWEGLKAWSEAFMDAFKAIFAVAFEAIRTAIGAVLEIIGSIFKSAWEGISRTAGAAIRGIVDAFLGMAATIVGAAAAAFSWVPGLGGKLDEAKRAIQQFRDEANRALGGINDKTVTIKFVRSDFIGPLAAGQQRLPAGFIGPVATKAQGGIVPGGLGEPRMILAHGGEQVVTHGQQLRSGGGSIVIPITLGGHLIDTLIVDANARTVRRGYAA